MLSGYDWRQAPRAESRRGRGMTTEIAAFTAVALLLVVTFCFSKRIERDGTFNSRIGRPSMMHGIVVLWSDRPLCPGRWDSDLCSESRSIAAALAFPPTY
jgi:hypothetical protein